MVVELNLKVRFNVKLKPGELWENVVKEVKSDFDKVEARCCELEYIINNKNSAIHDVKVIGFPHEEDPTVYNEPYVEYTYRKKGK